MIKKFSLGFAAFALVLVMGGAQAYAASTYAVNAITEDGALTITSAGIMAFVSGANAINLGTDAAAKTITVGNVTGATGVAINVGTGNFVLNGVAGSTYAIGAATTTGTITIGGTAQTGALTLGSSTGVQAINLGIGGTGAKTIVIGDGASTGATTIKAGSGGVLVSAASTTINGAFNYVADTGAADIYVATLVPAATAYVAGMEVHMKVVNVNATTTPTVNVNGLGAKTIVKRAATALAAGDMPAGAIAVMIYDGTNFQLINPVVN